MFEETLYQNTRKGQSMVDALKQNVSRGGGPPRFMPASQPASQLQLQLQPALEEQQSTEMWDAG